MNVLCRATQHKLLTNGRQPRGQKRGEPWKVFSLGKLPLHSHCSEVGRVRPSQDFVCVCTAVLHPYAPCVCLDLYLRHVGSCITIASSMSRSDLTSSRQSAAPERSCAMMMCTPRSTLMHHISRCYIKTDTRAALTCNESTLVLTQPALMSYVQTTRTKACVETVIV